MSEADETGGVDNDASALAELQADNQRRMTALMSQGMQFPNMGDVYQVCLLERILIATAPTEQEDPLTDARLDSAGRISHLLDDAERQLDRMKAQSKITVAPRMPPVPPGGIHLPGRNEQL